ncbi:hypothetical protein [Shewanella pealeana]|uniref:Isochorismatase n=1 Tax=Shewanella pealeana (strain ATCC 700345 / ANG-SQ1) TaxID=398579 RepID=A8GZP0_SHEPA|nr:hypothetical protein [Shewanella pealeana]ABV85777.1 conserved hypothetical protein [Shewanella pealeana ATCC 700345]
MSQQLIEAVKRASETWKKGFNTQDAALCAAQYEANAPMLARPFGEFVGTEAIQAFWQNLMDQGYSDVEYTSPEFKVLDDKSVLLTTAWKMNKAHGVVHKEIWVLQDDGTAKLADDEFEVLG